MLALTGCGGDDSPPDGTLTVSSVTPIPSTTPELVRFAFPVAGACLPSGDQLMPNAPREYRSGTHEGIDFYGADGCAAIDEGTEVVAAKAGTVVRADRDYREMTPEELAEIDARIAAEGKTDEEALNRFRGRQVWIDHGAGVVTRYAHLSGIAAGIRAGVAVKAGEVIGYVGNSGTPESVNGDGGEMHLHFEIRVGDGYLGKGLSPEEVRSLYEEAFAP